MTFVVFGVVFGAGRLHNILRKVQILGENILRKVQNLTINY